MNALSFGLVWIVAQTALGWDGHSRQSTGKCDHCGVTSSAVLDKVILLQNGPSWKTRERAANALREVDLRCHPEVVGALSYSLLQDRNDEVREEVAETLAKFARKGGCEPVVHEALVIASRSDRDLATRFKARRGLRNLSKHCRGECRVCESGTGGIVVSGPTVILPAEAVPSDSPVILEPAEVSPRQGVPEPLTPSTGPSVSGQSPSIDSRVAPAADPNLKPLSEPAEDLKPLGYPEVRKGRRPAGLINRGLSSRPHIVIRIPELFRPR